MQQRRFVLLAARGEDAPAQLMHAAKRAWVPVSLQWLRMLTSCCMHHSYAITKPLDLLIASLLSLLTLLMSAAHAHADNERSRCKYVASNKGPIFQTTVWNLRLTVRAGCTAARH